LVGQNWLKKLGAHMTTHLHFLVAAYAVFALAIVIEVISLITSRRSVLNAADMDKDTE
jgi:hypothetical protein